MSADGVIRLTDRFEIIHRIRGGNAVFLAIADSAPSRPRGYVQAAQEVLTAASAMTRGDPRMQGARLIEFESKSRSATSRCPRQDCRRLKIAK